MTFKNVTVSIDETIYTAIKQIALNEGTTAKEIINRYLADGVQKEKGQTKLG